jgi:adenylate kinase
MSFMPLEGRLLRNSPFGLLFIGGVHGVGKTTFAHILSHKLKSRHVSASQVIAGERAQVGTKTKLVRNIKGNQALLIEGLKRLRQKKVPLVLDGHFTLLDSKKSIKNVPIATFQKMRPSGIIVLTAVPGTISKRLEKRDGTKWSLEFIEKMQRAEVNRANQVASALKVPVFSSCSDVDFRTGGARNMTRSAATSLRRFLSVVQMKGRPVALAG